jgi:hypothetical protein
MAKDDRYKSDGNDQYGRPKTKISNLDSYMADPRTGVSGGYLAPLDLPFSVWGERKIDNGPLSKDEKSSRRKMNADAMEKGKYMKLAQMKAEKKKPKPPTPKPTPESKPKYKNVPMPNKSDSKKKYYGGM